MDITGDPPPPGAEEPGAPGAEPAVEAGADGAAASGTASAAYPYYPPGYDGTAGYDYYNSYYYSGYAGEELEESRHRRPAPWLSAVGVLVTEGIRPDPG